MHEQYGCRSHRWLIAPPNSASRKGLPWCVSVSGRVRPRPDVASVLHATAGAYSSAIQLATSIAGDNKVLDVPTRPAHLRAGNGPLKLLRQIALRNILLPPAGAVRPLPTRMAERPNEAACAAPPQAPNRDVAIVHLLRGQKMSMLMNAIPFRPGRRESRTLRPVTPMLSPSEALRGGGILLLACLLVAACESGAFDPNEGAVPESITLDVTDVDLVSGRNAVIRASVKDAAGKPINVGSGAVRVEWATSDERVASVTPLGKGTARVSAGAGGQAQITATVTQSIAQAGFLALLQGGPKKSSPKATATVHVGPAAVVYVSGGGQTGEVGSTLPGELVVRAVDGNGNGVPNVEIEFVPNPNHGTIAPAKVMTDEEGRARSRWTLGAAAGKLRAESRTHNRLKLAPIEFTATATATEGAGAPASVAVTPRAVNLNAIGDTVELSAVVRDSQGNALAGQSVTWSSRNTGIASVDAAGRVIAKKVGRAQIVASLASVVDSAVVDVKQLAAAVTITPGSATIALGDSSQFTAAVTDSNGVAIPAPTVKWSSSHPDVATVDGTGRVTTLKAGSTTLTATSDKASGTAAVTVEQPVAPPPPPPPPPPPSGILPAFPGAEGWGAAALNECRSLPLVVHKVTNTNDSGTGSLRDVLLNRTRSDRYDVVIFTTGGHIRLNSEISSTSQRNCIHIAGQTAPGGGITISHGRVRLDRHNNLVIRHLRHRGMTSIGFLIRDASRVVIANLTLSWNGYSSSGGSTNLTTGATINDMTIQNNMMYEPDRQHATVVMFGTGTKMSPDGERVSFIRNFMPAAGWRTPYADGRGVTVANNVVYNWAHNGAHSGNTAEVDWIGNYFRRGPATPASGVGSYGGRPIQVGDGCQGDGTPPCWYSIHVSGNLTSENQWGALPDSPWEGQYRHVGCWKTSIPQEGGGWCPSNGSVVPSKYRRATRLSAQPPILNLRPMSHAYADEIVNESGHHRALRCDGSWTSVRDAVDAQRIQWYNTGGGPSATISVETMTIPVPTAGTPCADSDGDGIPDAWEARFFGSATGANPAATTPSGYLVIEHYLNGTNPRE
jgi:uncharacterized protein YjdB